jgi:hypothetical protein
MVTNYKNGVFRKFHVSDVSSALFQDINGMRLGLRFQQGFEACFVNADSWVRLARDDFSENLLPRFYVSSHIMEFVSVDLYVQGRVWRSVEDDVESYVST